MAIEARKRPNIIQRVGRRLGEAYGVVAPEALKLERAAWIENGAWEHHNLLAGSSTPAARRAFTSNTDLVGVYSAVYACTRLRSRMITKPRIYLKRGDTVIDKHPALDAIHRMNESMTERQGRGWIEQNLCASGEIFLIKRRDRLGTVVEFEFWYSDETEVVADSAKPWAAAAYVRHNSDGSRTTVKPIDVIPIRHLLNPRDPLRGLGPIGAVRTQLDTGIEANRYNQRFFDNDTAPSRLFTVEEGGPAEAARIEQELERKFKGTDNAHRAMVTEGGLKLVEGSAAMSHKDMQFLEQQRWTNAETAMVFELSPISLGAVEGSTFSNVEWIDRKDWNAIVDQMENTLAQFTEFMLWPDFDTELEFAADYSMIPALQDDLKLRAEVDEIRLRTTYTTVNELRERDGFGPVAWGDTPVVQNTLEPLDMRTGAEKDATAIELNKTLKAQNAPDKLGSSVPSDKEQPRATRSLDSTQTDLDTAMQTMLRAELKGIIRHLEAGDARALRIEDVFGYGWDWLRKWGVVLREPLLGAFELTLVEQDFKETPMLPTHELAARYAEARAAELLSENGRYSLPAGTRDRVRELVAQAIERGDSMRTLKNALRQDGVFSESRAETIARTEVARAMGNASLKSYQSNGYEGKRWVTSGLDVDNNDAFGPCVLNEAAGPVALQDIFPSGDDTVPAHPRCRCSIVPVFEMPKRTVVHKKGTMDGRAIDIVETSEVR